MKRLAIVISHPIQYYSPWFRYLASKHQEELRLKVFYLWDFGTTPRTDPGFKQIVSWDVSLLEGYPYEFIKNTSPRPGTSSFWGLINPTLTASLRAYRPDHVLLFGYNHASLMNIILRWDIKIAPLIFRGDSHDLVSRPQALKTIKQNILGSLFKKFSAFLYVGKANYDYFIHNGVPREKLYFSPHSIDNERFFSCQEFAKRESTEWRRRLGIPSFKQVILFAGKFHSKKRPLDLIKAFIKADLPNAVLLFVGSGECEKEMRNRIRANKNIHILPFQNQSVMPVIYSMCDCFILPSFGPYETWGLAVNEAMCMSKAVIVSSHVGCAKDLVRHRHNGLVFEAGDVDALSRCLKQALENPQSLREWGINSRSLISRYNYAETTRGLLRALRIKGLNEKKEV